MSRAPQSIGSLADHFRKEWKIEYAEIGPAPTYNLAAHIKRQRMESFHKSCPEEFHQAIDRTKIKNLKAWDEADKWDITAPGIWIWSHATGEAKTRMLWRKFGQAHVEKGLTVQRTTGLNLAEEYHDCYKRNTTSLFYRMICATDVVMFDDLDKMRLPEDGQGYAEREEASRNARMLRELFDTFYEEHTQVLVTANEPISWFADRIGESAERRMRAVCTEIKF